MTTAARQKLVRPVIRILESLRRRGDHIEWAAGGKTGDDMQYLDQNSGPTEEDLYIKWNGIEFEAHVVERVESPWLSIVLPFRPQLRIPTKELGAASCIAPYVTSLMVPTDDNLSVFVRALAATQFCPNVRGVECSFLGLVSTHNMLLDHYGAQIE